MAQTGITVHETSHFIQGETFPHDATSRGTLNSWVDDLLNASLYVIRYCVSS